MGIFLLSCRSLVALLATSSSSSSRPKKPYVKTDHLLLQQVRGTPTGAVWIDLENVRGKSGFELDHATALRKMATWTEYHEMMERVIVVVDHGSVAAGYWLSEPSFFSVVFAGPSQKADDVIAHGVVHFEKSVVVTADQELQTRCRRSSRKDVHIMDPGRFLDDLEYAAMEMGVTDDELEQDSNELSLKEKIAMGDLDNEIRLRGKLLDLEIQLEKKKTITTKRRNKLKDKVNMLRQRLAMRGPSLLDQVTAIEASTATSSSSSSPEGLDSNERDMILSRWQEIQDRGTRREQTGDRVVYAENLRRQLLGREETQSEFNHEVDATSPSKFFAMQMNKDRSVSTTTDGPPTLNQVVEGRMLSKKEASTANMVKMMEEAGVTRPEQTTQELLQNDSIPKLDTLRIVAVSDTHGFQGQLLDPKSNDEVLPDGDVLIHLGDFAFDDAHHSDFKGVKAFDLWLAKQPHKYKIVVRGNHDPWSSSLQMSGAMYVTKPCTVNVCGFLLGMIPYGSSRQLSASNNLPTKCDILATHVPPFKVLDRTTSSKHAGSAFLSRIVRSMADDAPKLWLCGHIHEGRGHYARAFGHVETTVINAANANSGRATHLEHGAVVVNVNADSREVEILEMEDRKIEDIPSNKDFFDADGASPNELLLAVDLGLKSGVAMYSNQGALLRYEQFLFEKDTIQQTATNLISKWERELNEEMGEDTQDDEHPWRVTHVAIEGADGYMLNAWSHASHGLSILRVPPEEWRAEMLIAKEKASGSDAKAAARLIARQMVGDLGVMPPHTGKFPTDVAEAVVMGGYVSRKLGWVNRDPFVRRYQNGNIVVPKK